MECGEDEGWSVMKTGYKTFRHFRRFLFVGLFYSTSLSVQRYHVT